MRKYATVFSIFLLAALFYFLYLSTHQDPAIIPSSVTPPIARHLHAPLLTSSGVADASSPVPSTVATANESLGTVRGLVLQPDGKAAAGATLKISWSASILQVPLMEKAKVPIGVAPMLTDDRGTFLINDLPQGWIVLTAIHDTGRVTKRLHLDARHLNQTLTLVLAEGKAISGTVVRRDGSGIDGARVIPLSRDGGQELVYMSEARAAVTDHEGIFRLESLGLGNWTLYVAAPGFGSVLSEPISTGVENARIVLTTGIVLDCQVAGENGKPLSGIVVHASLVSTRIAPPTAVSDAAGLARFPDLGPGTYEIYVEDENYALRGSRPIMKLSLERKPATIRLMLCEGAQITGGVIDGDTGEGIPDVVVRAGQQSQGVFYSEPTTSDGSYTLSGLPEGQYRIETFGRIPGYPQDDPSVTRKSLSLAASAHLEGVDFVLTRRATLSGIVLDVVGAPVANATVRARNVDGGQNLAEYYTGSDGRFSFGDYVDGIPVNLAAEIQGRSSGLKGPILAGAPGSDAIELVLGLECGGIIAGRVNDSRGQPFECQIQAQAIDDALKSPVHLVSENTDSAGNFVLSDVCAGNYSLVIVPMGNVRKECQLVHLSPAESLTGLVLVYELGELFDLAGSVVDPEGLPVPNARVRASITGTEALLIPSQSTGQDGRFLFTGLPDGAYLLQAEATGFANMAFAQAEAGELDVEIQLTKPPLVSGTVSDTQGRPLSSFAVSFTPVANPDALPRSHAFQDVHGHFSLLLPNDGQWTLRFEAAGFAPGMVDVDSGGGQGETLELEIALAPAAQN